MATTLSYIDTNFHRVYDRTNKNELDKGLVTICNEFGKFGNSCLDFTNPDHKGIYFPNGIKCDTNGFVISAWIRLTQTIDNFVFIGNKEDATDIDAWEVANDSALSAETLNHTTTTNFVTSSDNAHIVSAAIIALDDYDWHHFVLTRVKKSDSDLLIQFVDGHKISESELDANKKIDFSNLVIGCSGDQNPLIGYMDDFCFIQNNYVWLNDFEPPTVPLREATEVRGHSDISAQTARSWNGSTDVIEVANNANIATWELLELDKSFKLKYT